MLQPDQELLELAEQDANKPPSQDKLDRLKAMGVKVMEVTQEITTLEKQLGEKRSLFKRLVTEEMPALFDETGVDRIGIPEYNVDLVMSNYYHANIATSWPQERREEAFAYLEEKGAGDIIKVDVAVRFGRKELTEAKMLAEHLKVKFGYLPTVEKEVPWNTLTSWLREDIEHGRMPDLDKIGA